MSIGGTDILIISPPDTPVADVILRQMSHRWPESLFLDVNDDEPEPLRQPHVFVRATRSREFFVLRDREAARSWDERGATPENANTMLHFLIRDLDEKGKRFREVTLVCDERTEWVDRLVADLEQGFRKAAFAPSAVG